MKVNILGNFFGTSGYAAHVRGLSNALNKLCDVKITTQLFPNWELQCNDEELKMINKQDENERINIIIDLPFNWIQHANKERNIGFLVWEGDKIPTSWIGKIVDERISQVWVPSQHVYLAIKKTIIEEGESLGVGWERLVKDRIKIVPHGFDPSLFYPKEKPKEIFRFVGNKGFRNLEDRGGLQYLIRAYLEEFTDQDNVELLLKLNPAYGIIDFNQVIKELAPRKEKLPKLLVNVESLNSKELIDIYNGGHVFVSPTRCEAFNIPCIEAMACGLPVITTGFGGQTDFVTNSNGWIIDYELKEVKHELMYEGVRWSTINMENLKKALRNCYENREDVRKKGEKSINESQDWTWNNSALKAMENLNIL